MQRAKCELQEYYTTTIKLVLPYLHNSRRPHWHIVVHLRVYNIMSYLAVSTILGEQRFSNPADFLLLL